MERERERAEGAGRAFGAPARSLSSLGVPSRMQHLSSDAKTKARKRDLRGKANRLVSRLLLGPSSSGLCIPCSSHFLARKQSGDLRAREPATSLSLSLSLLLILALPLLSQTEALGPSRTRADREREEDARENQESFLCFTSPSTQIRWPAAKRAAAAAAARAASARSALLVLFLS